MGYYQDIYGENMVVETEHAEDGTQIYQPYNIPVSYSGTNIIVTLPGITRTCKISKVTNAVIFECDNGVNLQQWYTIADIVR